MKTRILTMLATLATLLLITSCATGPYESKNDSAATTPPPEPVQLLDKDLRRTLTVVSTIATRDASNRLTIQSAFRNRTNDEDLHIQVQTVFYDKSGFILYSSTGSQPSWQSIRLTPNQTVNYAQTALTAEAANFTIRIRYAGKVEED